MPCSYHYSGKRFEPLLLYATILPIPWRRVWHLEVEGITLLPAGIEGRKGADGGLNRREEGAGYGSLTANNYLCDHRDQGYGRGGTPIFTGVFQPLTRVALYPTDEDGLGICFGAA